MTLRSGAKACEVKTNHLQIALYKLRGAINAPICFYLCNFVHLCSLPKRLLEITLAWKDTLIASNFLSWRWHVIII